LTDFSSIVDIIIYFCEVLFK